MDPTVEGRRALRGQYREIAAETLAGKENLVSGGAGLQELLHKVDELHSQAVRPREHAVDAEVFAQLAQCGLQMIMQGHAADEGRTPADLVRALRSTYGCNDTGAMAGGSHPDAAAFDWCMLGAAVSGLFKRAPGVGCMLGPLGAQAKVRKAVVRQPRRPVNEAVTRPDELAGIQEADKQETDRNYENMWRQLREREAAVPFVNLVCCHTSFSQTVENIFTLSFLVRDQRVQLLSSPEAGLSVLPITDEARTAGGQRGGGAPQQFMMNFTMGDWEAMKALVPQEDCVMPDTRAASRQPAAAAAAAASAAAAGGGGRSGASGGGTDEDADEPRGAANKARKRTRRG